MNATPAYHTQTIFKEEYPRESKRLESMGFKVKPIAYGEHTVTILYERTMEEKK